MATKTFLDIFWRRRGLAAKWDLPTATLDQIEALLNRTACDDRGYGFGLQTRETPYLETAQYAASLMMALTCNGRSGACDRYREGLASYVSRFWKKDSGFADAERGTPMLFATYFAVSTLFMLDRLDKSVVDGTARYLRMIVAKDGLARHEDDPPDMSNLFWAVAIASIIGQQSLFDNRLRDFVNSCWSAGMLYSNIPEGSPRLQPTVFAVLILTMLDLDLESTPERQIVQALNACAVKDGFADSLADKISTPAVTMFGAIGLRTLRATRQPACVEIDCRDLWTAHTTVTAYVACRK